MLILKYELQSISSWSFCLFMAAWVGIVLFPSPTQAQGRVVSETQMVSLVLETNRMVRIYLPPSYEQSPQRRYPVLYLHDGQNTFSTVGTNVAFGWGNWQLDLTVTDLIRKKQMQEIIMVAVDCSPQRYQEYRGPSYSTDTPPSPTNYFHRYSDFLIKELKPRIDREYRTLTNAENTAIMGSSLGGICSLTLAWEHPEVFGKAASLSGSYQIEKRDFLVNGLQKYQGKPKPVLVYLDSGVTDFMGGDDGRANTEQVAAELRRIGWVENKNLQLFIDAHPLDSKALEQSGLRKDKWAEAQKSQHNEFYWRLRAWRPLTFLFPPIEKP